ncbi:hypothetical protein [Actinophytocola xanthii]|uniref:Uncharacterized protein n=1 Tax=Actinophytocola xanthii TaxID=1912961 RepID=A0A1Q8CX08_9PSEU|nr:hypothetical protein [Actinophytocola xanthii]OLF18896.1 hypothetical protein BU204_03275 [Actinophytocola xanthii]
MYDNLRRAVLHRLDVLERAVDHADPSTLLPLARTELDRLVTGWRRLLRSHGADESGRCAACSRGILARRRPCPVWRLAHQQLLDEGPPHRARRRFLRAR